MKLNAPGTADAPENLARGVLIVMPPGFGPELDDAELPPEGEARRAFLDKIMRPRGVITAPRIDRGYAVAEALRWLSAAGFPVESQARRFSIFTWPEIWDGRARDGHVVRDAVSEAERLRDEFEKRTPLIAVFLSSQLLDAANDPIVRELLGASAGRPLEPAFRLSGERLRILGQRWEKTLMIGLPVPRRSMRPGFPEEAARAVRTLFVREEFL
ncbi:hypothetical protein [uncultured Sutterella sp.]|uniref:hypothetical protein n=1 Tax=uncultured Sutterella sp. TaxID=286133 RepID=UPI0026269554|nr:hypothetical protein [uncultured Sutterella sp.]